MHADFAESLPRSSTARQARKALKLSILNLSRGSNSVSGVLLSPKKCFRLFSRACTVKKRVLPQHT